MLDIHNKRRRKHLRSVIYREISYVICYNNKETSKNILHIIGKITVVIHVTKSRCDILVINTIKGLDIILSGQTSYPCNWYIIVCTFVTVTSGTHKILLGADKILIRRSSTAVVLTETVNRTFVVSLVLYTQL